MGSASETARGSHLHPKPVAGHRHHGRPEEDLPAVLRQVVQPGRRDVLPAARGHPPRPPDQRAHHLCQGHEGQVHQANPEEGLQVREQVRQAAGEGCQVCLCQPAEAVQGLSPPSSVTMTDSIQEGRWLCLSDHRWMILFSFVIAMFSWFRCCCYYLLSPHKPLRPSLHPPASTNTAWAWGVAMRPDHAADIFEVVDASFEFHD